MVERYWASKRGKELGQELATKLEDHNPMEELSQGRSGQVRRCYTYYYGIDASFGVHGSSQVIRAGEQGELSKVRINHSRALVNTMVNLITASKLVLSPKCVNIDSQSLKEVRLAQSLLEYYFYELGFIGLANQALEQAIGPMAGEGFVLLDWNAEGGDDYLPDPDNGDKVTKSGDIAVYVIPTWDVFRDESKRSWDAMDWVIVRRWVNKFDLAEEYAPLDQNGEEVDNSDSPVQQLRERILGAPRLSHELDSMQGNDSPDVELFYLYHKHRPSVRGGKRTLFLADGTLLEDGPLSYDKWPLKRVVAAELYDTPYPYTPFLEILGIQEMMDSLESTIASNQIAFGTQYIVAEKDSDISPEDLSSGLRLLYVNNMQTGKPEALQLTKTAPEIFTHLELLKKYQELIFGLNSVVRGEPQSGEQSGSALALLSSQALQQASTIHASYLQFVQDIGECVFEMLKKNLSAPKKLAIVGKGNAFLIDETEITRDSFSRIKRIQVETGNPMAQTSAGRVDMAKDLLATLGAKMTPEQYLQVIETGKLEPLTEALQNELLLIKSENEAMRAGENPPVTALDKHMLHVREHAGELANPLLRKDPEAMRRLLAHIIEHEQLFFTTPPGLLFMSGQEPPPPGLGMMGPGGAGGAGGMPPGGLPPQEGSQPAPSGAPGNPQAGAPTQEPPRLPTNPLSGNQYDPQTGGL